MKLIPLFILFLSLTLAAQEVPQPVLIDEFDRISCDDYLQRVDNLLIALGNDPAARGYVVIQARGPMRRRLAYELWFYGALRGRGFDRSRITLVRGPESPAEAAEIRFWLVPPGSQSPDTPSTNWHFGFTPKTKPYVFRSEMDDQICSSPDFAVPYKEYLDANPGSRGHIVIYAPSRRSYHKALKLVRLQLKEISPERLRFFHVSIDPSPHGDNSYAEYWLVPKKMR